MSFIINVFVNSEGMKKLHILLCLLLWSMPNIAHAQFNSFGIGPTTTWEREAQAQHRRNYKFGHRSKNYQTAKKAKVKVPATNIHTAIELSIDEATGKTTARWKDGSVFVGETYYGELKGTGTMTFADGGKYHGQWRFDRFHGVGTMEYADGGKYIGQWSWGKPHGQGTIVEPNGVKITAKFDEGIPRGKCIIQDVDGRLYTGRWSSGILREKSIKPLEEK